MRKIAITLFALLALQSCNEKKSEISTSSPEKEVSMEIQNLSAVEFKEGIGKSNAVLIDVRTPEEIAEGKIKNAVMINYFDPGFSEQILEIPKDKAVYIYCSAGKRSAETAKLLSENGYTNVSHLTGGLTPWVNAGFELVKD